MHAFLKLTRGTCSAAIKESEKPWLRLIFQLINAKQSSREGNWIATLLKARALSSASFPEVGVQKESQRGSASVKKSFLSCEGMRMSLKKLGRKGLLDGQWRKLLGSQPPVCSDLPVPSHTDSYTSPCHFSRSPWQQQKVTSRQLESVHQGLPSVLMNSGAAMWTRSRSTY